MRQDQVGRHEAAVAPSVYTDTVGIHVRKRFQIFHTFHLVGHFIDAQVTVDHAFESESPVGRAPVVDRENHVAALCHIDIPASYTVLPAARYQLRVGAAVDVDDGRIFLAFIQADRFDQAEMQVGRTVGSLYGACFYFRQCVAFVRVPGGQEVFDLLAVFGPDQVDDARDFRCVVIVDCIFAGGAD